MALLTAHERLLGIQKAPKLYSYSWLMAKLLSRRVANDGYERFFKRTKKITSRKS